MFRFTIRELVLLTLVVAMGVGWWIREQQLQRSIAWLELAIDREGYEVQEDQYGPFILKTHDGLDAEKVLDRRPD
jgi:hypothetical protein